MRVVLDACVLFPTVLREILLGVAARGLYTPLWSERILEEWARATRRLGPAAEVQARAEVAAVKAAFPKAMVLPQPGLESRLHLPDEADIHVLAAAIGSHADAILTFNAADFPRGVLAAEGLARRDPDGFLWELWSSHPETVATIVREVHAKAEAIAGAPLSLRALLKRARLPRLAKALQT
ncbi:RSP_2648 family PIN domain-containing protein [Rhodobacter sp. CZR27]|uniref:RSP_2648 family PIN domain-containing protein n=1 Tax=Rhodobacter sp. CZR27 TaxID=2033869 RepID=UPI000BBF318A|nr:PIN domain-containing protein [Rhodobacter sp. CZR27]